MIETWIEQLGSTQLVERLAAENAVIIAEESADANLIGCLTSENNERRWRSAYVLGDRGARGAVEQLYPLLNDGLWDVRAATAYALGMIGDARAFDTLSSIALSPKPDEQTNYVAALGLFRLDRDRARAILSASVTHETEQIRRTAMSALAVDRYSA